MRVAQEQAQAVIFARVQRIARAGAGLPPVFFAGLWVLLGLGLLTVGCGGGGGRPQWAVYLYVNGDNDLANAALADLDEMAAAGISRDVAVVVQVDLPRTPTRRYRLVRGGFELLEDLGERDMAAPETITEFLAWAGKAFPARKRALVLWNHGNGWDQADGPSPPAGRRAGSILHELQGDDRSPFLANHRVRAAIEAAKVPLDLLGLDASIMGTMEALYEFRTLAPVLVTSQEVGQLDGWDYTAVLGRLYEAPEMDAEELGRVIVEAHEEFFESVFYPANPIYEQRHMVAAHRAGLLAEIAAEVDSLAAGWMARLADPEDRAAAVAEIAAARGVAQGIDREAQPNVYVDLADLVGLLDAASPIPGLVAEATIAAYRGRDRPNAHGMSIVFFSPAPLAPAVLPITYDPNYRCYDPETGIGNAGEFLCRFGWDEFLDAYYEAAGLL